MKFSKNLLLILVSGILAAGPVMGARGRPRRLDHDGVQERDLAEFEDLQLAARWSMDAIDDMAVSRGLTDLLHSKKPISIRCIAGCHPTEQAQIASFVQKKYNKDKSLNKGEWTNIDIKVVGGGKRIIIQGTLYRMENGKKTAGGDVNWIVDNMKEVH